MEKSDTGWSPNTHISWDECRRPWSGYSTWGKGGSAGHIVEGWVWDVGGWIGGHSLRRVGLHVRGWPHSVFFIPVSLYVFSSMTLQDYPIMSAHDGQPIHDGHTLAGCGCDGRDMDRVHTHMIHLCPWLTEHTGAHTVGHTWWVQTHRVWARQAGCGSGVYEPRSFPKYWIQLIQNYCGSFSTSVGGTWMHMSLHSDRCILHM